MGYIGVYMIGRKGLAASKLSVGSGCLFVLPIHISYELIYKDNITPKYILVYITGIYGPWMGRGYG